jgi:hypothetical protein
MKILLLILSCFLFINTVTNAQYKINKTQYDYRTYKHQIGDPYNPSVDGFASFLIPGLGQMSTGELRRGFAFLGEYAGCWAICAIGASTWYEEDGVEHGGPLLVYLGFFCAIGVDLFSVVDAIRVAKVNDLFFRDKKKAGYNLQLSPYFGSSAKEKIPVGVSLKVLF